MRFRRGSFVRNVSDVDNFPIISSPYDEKVRRLMHANPTLFPNRVHIPWYRRYIDVIPEKENQILFQPYREIQTRDEDIALQHQFGAHECMQDYVSKGMCQYSPVECKRIREAAMSRYNRIKKREEEKKLRVQREAPAAEENAVVLAGQDIDLTTEFGFSANKKKIVVPVVNFLCKLHVNREREAIRRKVSSQSKWFLLQYDAEIRANLKELIRINKKNYARNRIKRLFSLVLCVDRFIKCVAMIAGDTQTLLKDTTQKSGHQSGRKTDSSTKLEIVFFDVQNYMKVGQVQVPFHIQLILGKPWFIRTTKEVETAVKFLEKMRCFTAYPRPFQYMLARVAWYLELPTQKVVIRQSQQAVNFYLLLHGQVRIDRLVGSPCEEEGGHFKTTSVLTSQDMFGDECITQPFSERTYTATTEEKCAALDFNMHDYNNMIQTANTSEEAPDHIRFLCKLRIMDSFPKIKLLQEQDNNVTYFFFRPGTLVCKSVRDSPYVFVIRNGSCSALHELKPKITHDSQSPRQSRLSGMDRSTMSNLAYRRWSIASRTSRSTYSRESLRSNEIKTNRISPTEEALFEGTRRFFEANKLGMADGIRDMRDKAQSITKTMSNNMRQKFNLQDTLQTVDDNPMNTFGNEGSQRNSLKWVISYEESPSRHSSRHSSRRASSSLIFERKSSIASAVSARTSLSKQRTSGHSTSKIVGTNIPLTIGKLLGDQAPLVRASSSFNMSNSATVKDTPGPSSTERNANTKNRPGERSFNTNNRPGERNVNTINGPGERNANTNKGRAERNANTKNRPGERNANTNKGRAERNANANKGRAERNANTNKGPGERNVNTNKGPGERNANTNKGRAERNANTNKREGQPTLDPLLSRKPTDIEAPLSRYSQWCHKTLLTVTDVAGVDWLDYHDGTYNPPQEDVSLVSHGATIIMIKKDFMLKYLRRVW